MKGGLPTKEFAATADPPLPRIARPDVHFIACCPTEKNSTRQTVLNFCNQLIVSPSIACSRRYGKQDSINVVRHEEPIMRTMNFALDHP